MSVMDALSLRMTDAVATLLQETASCSCISESVRAKAQRLKERDTIAWEDLKSIAEAFKKGNPGKPVYLHKLCSRQDIVLQSPPPKEKSPELQARLARLQEELDNKRYSDMVADITTDERKADDMRNAVLPTAHLQLSFGAHVLVTMFTFWAVAYYGSKYYLSLDELWAGLAGALGLTLGMLVETLLLIIRSNRPVPMEERMPELFDKTKVQEAFAKARELKQVEKFRKKQQQKQGAAAGAKKSQPGQSVSDVESKKGR